MIEEQMEALKAQNIAHQSQDFDEDEAAVLIDDFEEDFEDAALDVELPSIDLDVILADFNWNAGGDAAALEASLITELQALEAANVHNIIQSESQANLVVQHIDQSLEELNQIEKWLAYYTNLLEKMGNDVHHIEAQNKGMQVTSNNQKNLLTELEAFIASLRVPGYILEILTNEPLDSADGIKECEKALDRVMAIIRYKNDGTFV